jgi:hypothetical protein
MDERKYIDGTEQFVAAVWYVMKEAEAEYHRNRRRIEKGRLNRWYFLRRIQKALDLGPAQVNYGIMRAELEEFALTFGVSGKHPDAPVSQRNLQAQKEFGS